MKKVLFISVLLFTSIIYSQNMIETSSLRNFLENNKYSFIEVKHKRPLPISLYSESVTGERIRFCPIKITNIENNKVRTGLKIRLDHEINNKVKNSIAYLDENETKEFIKFMETYVIPHLTDRTDKSKEKIYSFRTKEIRIDYSIKGKKPMIVIEYKVIADGFNPYMFWTKRDVKLVAKVIEEIKNSIF